MTELPKYSGFISRDSDNLLWCLDFDTNADRAKFLKSAIETESLLKVLEKVRPFIHAAHQKIGGQLIPLQSIDDAIEKAKK